MIDVVDKQASVNLKSQRSTTAFARAKPLIQKFFTTDILLLFEVRYKGLAPLPIEIGCIFRRHRKIRLLFG
jgi:hypothetical protein